jgi:hypothetical protein
MALVTTFTCGITYQFRPAVQIRSLFSRRCSARGFRSGGPSLLALPKPSCS